MSKPVRVQVTNKKAVYVDGVRITHRGTRWGTHMVLDSFTCNELSVYAELLNRGYTEHALNIDIPKYMDDSVKEPQ